MGEVIVTTPELRIGDIVTHYGIRIRLSRPAYVESRVDYSRPGETTDCYAWYGDVENIDEVAGTVAPRSWFYGHGGINKVWDGTAWVAHDGPTWNVQGNKYARWRVERADVEAAQ